jgi:hypothetical protein
MTSLQLVAMDFALHVDYKLRKIISLVIYFESNFVKQVSQFPRSLL